MIRQVNWLYICFSLLYRSLTNLSWCVFHTQGRNECILLEKKVIVTSTRHRYNKFGVMSLHVISLKLSSVWNLFINLFRTEGNLTNKIWFEIFVVLPRRWGYYFCLMAFPRNSWNSEKTLCAQGMCNHSLMWWNRRNLCCNS